MRALLLLSALLLGAPGCRCDLDPSDYAPQPGDWPTSTLEAEGLDPELVARLYCDASRESTLYGLLIVKGGALVAEAYFNEGAVDQLSSRASVTKSYTSALVGQAIDQGCLPDVDAHMMDYFPEYADQIEDPRKADIRLRDMLEMRSGYPWEESDPALWEAMFGGEYLDLMVSFPLTADPGTVHQYSNLSTHWLGVIVARACGADLQSFAEQQLFAPIDAEVGGWQVDADGYRMGAFGLEVTARDMARFGQLYLDGGRYGDTQVVPEAWVRSSLIAYADPTGPLTPGPEFEGWGYGYQWWNAQAGPHDVWFAWGHGGSFIFLVQELELVVVVTADPFIGEHSDRSWRHEKAHLNLIGGFLSALEEA